MPPEPPPVDFQTHALSKYRGAIAEGYDAKRETSEKWLTEDRLVKDMLADLLEGSWILDCPVGTGRFLPYYAEKKWLVRALDASDDMLNQAIKKAGPGGLHVWFGLANILDSRVWSKSVDAAVMVRLSRWLSPPEFVVALRELQRIARKRIVFTARVRNHVHTRDYEMIRSALNGWHIARDEAGADQDYRIIALEPD